MNICAYFVRWWRWWDSNPWPPACRAGALPAELHPHIKFEIQNSKFEIIGLCFFSVLRFRAGGDDGIRTHDPLLAGQVLSQLSYTPRFYSWVLLFLLWTLNNYSSFTIHFSLQIPSEFALVGPSGLEPPTSCLSGTRSNLLSYDPMWLVWLLFTLGFFQSREQISLLSSLCWQWAIFPCRFQQSIFATAELNFCVRYGYRWTLCVCSTDFFSVTLRHWILNNNHSSYLGYLRQIV